MNDKNKSKKNAKQQKPNKQQKTMNGCANKTKTKSQIHADEILTKTNSSVKDVIKSTQRKPYSHKSLTLANENPNDISNLKKPKNDKDNKHIPLSDGDNENFPPVPKMERSRSFFLTRKLSKMLNHLSGSKENLSSVPLNKEKDINSNNVPYQFIRSKSMILLKSSKRKSFGTPLEKLSEESERPYSPESVQNKDKNIPLEEHLKENQSKTRTLPIIREPSVELRRVSLDLDKKSASAIVPSDFAILDRRKSGVLVEKLKRIVPERRKSVSTKWSSSLQSLQEIDHMISYENLSFIDYDKFNEYEKHLDREIANEMYEQNVKSQKPRSLDNSTGTITNNVRFREKRGRASLNQTPRSIAEVQNIEKRIIANEMANNWKTQSLDDRKLIEIGENFQSDFEKFENLGNENNINIHSTNDLCDAISTNGILSRSNLLDSSDINKNNYLQVDFSASTPNLNVIMDKSLGKKNEINEINKIPNQNYQLLENGSKISLVKKPENLNIPIKNNVIKNQKKQETKNNELENNLTNNTKTIITTTFKRNLKNPKTKQRKLIRSPEKIFCDTKNYEYIPISVIETETSSTILSETTEMGSDISSTTIKTTTIEKETTEKLLTSTNNTKNTIFDHFYDRNIIISKTTTTTSSVATTETTNKSLSSDQIIPLKSDLLNRITPVENSSNSLNICNSNKKSDNVNAFFEASGNTSSSELSSGNFNSITGTVSSSSYYSDDYEFSILSNLNIDSEISDITTHSNSNNISASQLPSPINNQEQTQQDRQNFSNPDLDYNIITCFSELQNQLLSTTTSNTVSIGTLCKEKTCIPGNSNDNSPPMRLAECEDIISSDLSTSASTKLTSTNTSFSNDSCTGGSMDGPPSPGLRFQTFKYKSTDSNRYWDTQISPQLPIPPPVPQRSFQMQIERQKQYANIENSMNAITQQNTPPMSRSQTPDKNISMLMNFRQLTSPNNPFLPEIIADRYPSDDDLDENVVSPICPLKDAPISENFNIIDPFIIPDEISSKTQSPNQLSDTNKFTNTCTVSHNIENKECFVINGENKKQTNIESKNSKITPQNSIKRNLNPFSKYYNGPSSSAKELNSKRKEFLTATMKICLVVSPPTTKLHVKSKSLTHLDILNYPNDESSNKSNQPYPNVSDRLDTFSSNTRSEIPIFDGILQKSKDIGTQMQNNFQNKTCIPLHHYQMTPTSITKGTSSSNTCNNICCLGKANINSTETSITYDHYDENNDCQTVSGTALAAASLNAASIHQFSGSIYNQNNSSNIIKTKSNEKPTDGKLSLKNASVKSNKSSFMCKKPGLSRSEVSSSEYFSVHFYTENGGFEEELIQIKRGVSLLKAIDDALKRRSLNISQINISDSSIDPLTEAGTPSYGSLIDENIDIEFLLGKILTVTKKQSEVYLKSSKLGSLQKAASFGSRARPPRLLSSASTEETSSEPDPKVVPAKQLKQRWSGLFGVKNPQQNQLADLLDKFSKQGGPPKKLPKKSEHINFEWDALNYLQTAHKCWREFVYHENLPDNEIKIQSAIWELVTTEIAYIHTLQTVTDLFLACLEALQDNNILTDVDQNKLFSNIREICQANLKFWTLYLYPMVADSILHKSPMRIDYFEQGFVTFGTTFSPYKVFCAEQSTCQFYCKELNRSNTDFTTYLIWCESQKHCNRLRLADILVRPMQRLTKYNLLLLAIRKHIIIENDIELIDSMIRSVENFVYSVNTHLSTRQENERLKGIMARIESYDVVEASNDQLDKLIKQYSQTFDLCSPMKGCSNQHCRHLFMEGDLKLKDNQGKSDVHCFLLTDILLICKTISKKSQGALKIIRQPYFTDRLVIKQKDNSLYCAYLNEFQVAIAAFILQCSEAKNWIDGLTKAKHIYTRLKQSIQCDINFQGQSYSGENVNMLGIKKSPFNSSRGSHVSSLNNSHSGSVELNDSKNISIDFEKANSLSSDEGTNFKIQKVITPITVSPQKVKSMTGNTLTVEPLHNLGQSLPNLTTSQTQISNLYHTYSNNTLLVPGYGRGCASNILLSPSHRGISYPPPSPTRATLRRGLAFSSTIKNPPLQKTRNITSQNSVNSYSSSVAKTEILTPQKEAQSFLGANITSSSELQSPSIQTKTFPSISQLNSETSSKTTQIESGQYTTNESDV